MNLEKKLGRFDSEGFLVVSEDPLIVGSLSVEGV